jgi:hypothetical protein
MALPAVPLQRKLNAITLTTCGIALLITTLLFLLGELFIARQSNLQQLKILSEAIASNCTAALAFENPDDASSVLAALRSDPHIAAAALYKADGSLFATFPDQASAAVLPITPPTWGFRFERAHLIGSTEVREGGRALGTLVVRADMAAIYERVGMQALLSALVIAFALLAAWAISRRLQRQLSEPILALAAVAEVVSQRQDYS